MLYSIMGLRQNTCKYTFIWFNFVFLINLLINKIFQIAEIVSVIIYIVIVYCKSENQMQRK